LHEKVDLKLLGAFLLVVIKSWSCSTKLKRATPLCNKSVNAKDASTFDK